MENNAAHKAIIAAWVSPPKSTILLIVAATELLIFVMIRTPRKLKTALIMIALLTPIHRVVTQVAIAFGASVQPLTKITPRVNRTVMSRTGFPAIALKKTEKDTSIKLTSDVSVFVRLFGLKP